jgi:hypothetical protein
MQKQCAGATGDLGAKCSGIGTFAGGSGACSLYDGGNGPKTCKP